VDLARGRGDDAPHERAPAVSPVAVLALAAAVAVPARAVVGGTRATPSCRAAATRLIARRRVRRLPPAACGGRAHRAALRRATMLCAQSPDPG
jgi:hypothetical protein